MKRVRKPLYPLHCGAQDRYSIPNRMMDSVPDENAERRQIVDKLTFEAIKKSIKILKIDKDNFIVTIGSPKGYWSKGLKYGNKKRGRLCKTKK